MKQERNGLSVFEQRGREFEASMIQGSIELAEGNHQKVKAYMLSHAFVLPETILVESKIESAPGGFLEVSVSCDREGEKLTEVTTQHVMYLSRPIIRSNRSLPKSAWIDKGPKVIDAVTGLLIANIQK